MNNKFLYILTTLIWGTTWYAVKLQVPHAPAELSIFYRCILASLGLILLCLIKGHSLKVKPKDHLFLLALGLTMFCAHFFFLYYATAYIVSGVCAVIFSSVNFFCIFNNYLFFRIKPSLFGILGALIGMLGLSIFFWNEIAQISVNDQNTLKGLYLAGIGALVFSLGSSLGTQITKRNLEIVPSVAIATSYGTLLIFIYTTLTSTLTFMLPPSVVYWSSVLYIAFFGSIIAFLSYLKLIKDIGTELAGYILIICPIVALFVSWTCENCTRSLMDLVAFSLIVVGNILVLKKNY